MKKKKSIELSRIQEIKNGKLEGGFTVIATNALIIGGDTQPTNNCDGGKCTTNNCDGGNCKNCVLGCGGS